MPPAALLVSLPFLMMLLIPPATCLPSTDPVAIEMNKTIQAIDCSAPFVFCLDVLGDFKEGYHAAEGRPNPLDRVLASVTAVRHPDLPGHHIWYILFTQGKGIQALFLAFNTTGKKEARPEGSVQFFFNSGGGKIPPERMQGGRKPLDIGEVEVEGSYIFTNFSVGTGFIQPTLTAFSFVTTGNVSSEFGFETRSQSVRIMLVRKDGQYFVFSTPKVLFGEKRNEKEEEEEEEDKEKEKDKPGGNGGSAALVLSFTPSVFVVAGMWLTSLT